MIPLHNYQGGWETDESITEAASRETVEEAGVRGIIEVSGYSGIYAKSLG